MKKKLHDASVQIADNRQEIISKLVQFSLTDMLLFWSTNKELANIQQKKWAPILKWANSELNNNYKTTTSLDVPEQEQSSAQKLFNYLQKLDNKQLSALLSAALTMRSVLLATALIKGKINADDAFEASFIEELWQASHWGIDKEAEQKRENIRNELRDIESFLAE